MILIYPHLCHNRKPRQIINDIMRHIRAEMRIPIIAKNLPFRTPGLLFILIIPKIPQTSPGIAGTKVAIPSMPKISEARANFDIFAFDISLDTNTSDGYNCFVSSLRNANTKTPKGANAKKLHAQCRFKYFV